MEKEFVTYEIAVKLKELGFNEQCLAVYINNKLTIEDDWLYSTNKDTFIESTNCTAPLWQQVIDWFRKEYKLHITITSQSQESWQWHIQFPHDSLNKLWEEDFYFYEEAREAAILKALQLCQKEK